MGRRFEPDGAYLLVNASPLGGAFFLGVSHAHLAANLFANSDSFDHFSVSVERGFEQAFVNEFGHVVCLVADALVLNNSGLIAPARPV